MSVVIKIESLSKKYKLGTLGSSTLASELNDLYRRIRGIEDEEIDFYTHPQKGKIHWALRDIDLEVEEGEVLGIVGKNGAGKSTLLKIISKITSPTSGTIKIKGRVASLLEVGTGFHPELTGRDNIYLNGAILGMSQNEVKRKFEEIVDFAGIDKFIDTPVKRYSSGMYVRLAFAVAAHLEPEILIIDEVLSVGDAEFQKKCLGKMKDVSKQGRTVIFVSHQIATLQSLCKKSVFLEKGRASGIESISESIKKYLYGSSEISSTAFYPGDNANVLEDYRGNVRLIEAYISNANKQISERYKTTEDIYVVMKWENLSGIACSPNIQVTNQTGVKVMIASDAPVDWDGHKKKEKGTYLSTFKIPKLLLNAGEYFFSFALDSHSPRACYEYHVDVSRITVWDSMDETNTARGMFVNSRDDVVLWPALECSFEKLI